jgi:hypothetical protein
VDAPSGSSAGGVIATLSRLGIGIDGSGTDGAMMDAVEGAATLADGAIDNRNPICTVAVLEALLPLR